MTPEKEERFISALERLATVAERWADSEYPKRDETEEEPEIIQVGHPREPRSREEYDRLPDREIGRFEKQWKAENT